MATVSTQEGGRHVLRHYAVAYRKRADGPITTFEMTGTLRQIEKALFNQGVVKSIGGRCAFGFNGPDGRPQVVSHNDTDSRLHAAVITMLESS